MLLPEVENRPWGCPPSLWVETCLCPDLESCSMEVPGTLPTLPGAARHQRPQSPLAPRAGRTQGRRRGPGTPAAHEAHGGAGAEGVTGDPEQSGVPGG